MATNDPKFSVFVHFLSKQKSTRSTLKLREPCNGTSVQERLCRKRKLRSMVILLMGLLSQCMVERSVWQRQQTSAWLELAYQTFSESEWLKKFCISRSMFQFLVDELQDDLVRQDTVMRKAIEVKKKGWLVLLLSSLNGRLSIPCKSVWCF